MKRVVVILAVLGLFLMTAVGCGSSDDDASGNGSESAASGTFDQVVVGMTEQEVTDLLGESDGTGENEMSGENGLIFIDDNMKMTTIWFKDGKVSNIVKPK